MSVKRPIIEIGYDKNGEMDFGVSGEIGGLNLDQLKELRETIVVAIWCTEDMWHRNQEVTPHTGEKEASNDPRY